MAKKKHIAPSDLPRRSIDQTAADGHGNSPSQVNPLAIAAGILAGLLVYVSYFPSDSVAVEHGDAIWVTLLSLAIAAITFAFDQPKDSSQKFDRFGRAMDWLAWLIALWVMLGAFQLSPPGNLRMATNEGWLWIAGAAVFTAARRIFVAVEVRRSILVLMIACASGLAVHGLHQHLVSLPYDRARYQQDPEAILREAGFDAPEGSALRMVFENRLNDGGATATFSLANSLAAVMLIGVVGTLGAIRCTWPQRGERLRWEWFMVASSIAVLVCCAGLLITSSRSAVLATISSVAILTVLARFRRSLFAMMGVAFAAVVVLISIASFGNAEWLEQAPASLAFRFRYWRSTVQLVLQHPWFGAGPGNFQSAYERFREDAAHEQIADPHNLFFETLASGGWFAAIALLMLAGLVASMAVKRLREPADVETDTTSVSSMQSKWVWLGSVLGLTVVWLLSITTGVLPDVEAHLYAVPVAMVVAVCAWPAMQRLSPLAIDSIASVCLFGLTLHLIASGGWTVPGVAIEVWLLSAMLSRAVQPETEQRDASLEMVSQAKLPNRRLSHAAALLVALLIGCLYFVSIIPMQQSKSAITAANVAANRGQFANARQHLDSAIASDPWSVEAVMQKADLQRWELVVQEPTRSRRAAWETSLGMIRRRAGENPTVLEAVGTQQIHLYQRYGEASDLQAAHATFQAATLWSRANERLYAQLALIESELGNRRAAETSAKRARELSEAGGIYERSMTKQMVVAVKPVGVAAEREVVVGFASDLLGEPLTPDVPSARELPVN